jgi:hypothetical protein
VQPETALQIFLTQVRNAARKYLPAEQRNRGGGGDVQTPFCEVEARLGILKVNHATPDRRVTSTGAKTTANGTAAVRAFDCTRHQCNLVSGVGRSQFVRTTAAGVSEVSALTQALGVTQAIETEWIETVYTGYANDGRVCFPGEHPGNAPTLGKMESKEKLGCRI